MFQPLCFFFTFFFFSSVVKFVCWTRGKNKVRYPSVSLFPSGFVFLIAIFTLFLLLFLQTHYFLHTYQKKKKDGEERNETEKGSSRNLLHCLSVCCTPSLKFKSSFALACEWNVMGGGV
ncbi:uncharacterized protein TEOVI_000734200 [Trypanosoma equiperdum]|uniref:Uncharacterized protein n=2 Tax=Trypanozoon TaxID=39700 RepID=Q4GZ83_TRYB2|nr:hypothetical protein, unlikely [Trypanosoma brucei brucei TREU927]CAJ16094.1 hypothetical protein, unlikely [Trypanosoma brucei brucei TREU927]SCU73066.1 hypothetical protein, conserved [Trypanosoma equiperdum]